MRAKAMLSLHSAATNNLRAAQDTTREWATHNASEGADKRLSVSRSQMHTEPRQPAIRHLAYHEARAQQQQHAQH